VSDKKCNSSPLTDSEEDEEFGRSWEENGAKGGGEPDRDLQIEKNSLKNTIGPFKNNSSNA
jgi:hypothetical protein